MGSITTYTYDPNGNILTKTNANGNVITYTYDNLNRLIIKNYPDATRTAFTYNTMGRITTASNQNITYTLTYDARGNITNITDSMARNLTYQYDAANNKTQMNRPDVNILYTYDSNKRPIRVTASGLTFSLYYNPAGKRTKLTYPNGITTTYTYDTANNLTGMLAAKARGISYNQTYQYNKTNIRTAYTEPNGTHTYGYDKIEQLWTINWDSSI